MSYIEEKAVPAEIHNGFVAFTDVLGFSAAMQNDDAQVVGDIFDVLDMAYSNAKGGILSQIFDDYHPDPDGEGYLTLCKESEFESNRLLQLVHDHLILSVISDSIICACDMSNVNDTEDKRFLSLYFMEMLHYLVSNMFSRGLPLRGGVSYGKFFCSSRGENKVSPNLFAGSALFSAHRLESEINAAVVVVDNEAIEKITEFCGDKCFACGDICAGEVAYKKNETDTEWKESAIISVTGFTDTINGQSFEEFYGYIQYLFKLYCKTLDARARMKCENTFKIFKNILVTSQAKDKGLGHE